MLNNYSSDEISLLREENKRLSSKLIELGYSTFVYTREDRIESIGKILTSSEFKDRVASLVNSYLDKE